MVVVVVVVEKVVEKVVIAVVVVVIVGYGRTGAGRCDLPGVSFHAVIILGRRQKVEMITMDVAQHTVLRKE